MRNIIPWKNLWLFLALPAALLLPLFSGNPIMLVRIRSNSMQPTLHNGQWVLALRGQIKPGGIAIFRNPHTQRLNVKRYIMDSARPPNIQHGWLITPSGYWFLSEKQWEYIEKSYHQLNSNPQNTPSSEYLFFVGDNQFQSYDSRDFGYVPRSHVIGRVLLMPGWRHDP